MPTRRQFTMSLGAALLCAPFAGLLRPAAASPPPTADRLILMFSPNGTIHRFLRPTGGETSFAFPPGGILEPLAAHRADLVYLDGIDFTGVSNHEDGMANMLTGGYHPQSVSRGQSVDQFIAGRLGGTRFPSIELGVQASLYGGSVDSRMSYAGLGRFVTPDDNPLRAFSRLFGAALPGADAARLLRRRQSVLDHVRGELSALMTRLGTIERAKLEQHLDALRTLEAGLAATPACAAPDAPPEMDLYAPQNLPAVGKAQMDLLVAALACGLTRVASLQWAFTLSPHVFSWIGVGDAHHTLSHSGDDDAGGMARFVACERWYAGQFAYLLQRLKDTPDPRRGGSLLDSSLVAWCKELGDSRLHTCLSVPFILAGRANGALRTGRYLQYNGTPHQRLLTWFCQAMGLNNSSFGDISVATGALTGLA